MANLLELPLELFESLITLLLSLDRLDDALRLTHTCKALRHTGCADRVNYFRARARLCLPIDRVAVEHLQHSTRALLASHWPHPVPESSDAALLGPSCSRYEGTPLGARPRGTPSLHRDKIYDLSLNGRSLLVQQLGPRTKRDDADICAPASEEHVDATTRISLPIPACAFAVDPLCSVAIIVSQRSSGSNVDDEGFRQTRLDALDLWSGTSYSSFVCEPGPFQWEEVKVEVHGSSVLLRQGEMVEVRRLARPRTQEVEANRAASWPLVWMPKIVSTSQRLLCAHLLSDSVLMLLREAPATSDHGLDWGSTLEVYNLNQSQPHVADVRLPIRARPVPGLSYIKCGGPIADGTTSRSQRRNGLMLICVEGMIWQAELDSFLDLIYPGTALALYMPGQPTYPILDASWVKANMSRFSLCISEGAPVAETSVSGYRMVAIWRTARQTAGYIRFVDLTPSRSGDDRRGKALKRQEATLRGGKEVAIFSTWWAEKERPFIYYDHALEDYLPDQNVQHTSVMLDGARLLLSSARAVAGSPAAYDSFTHPAEESRDAKPRGHEATSKEQHAQWEGVLMDGGRSGTLPFAAVWLV